MISALKIFFNTLFPRRPKVDQVAPKNHYRPNCPQCGRELVFAAIVAGGEFFCAWLCDCDSQPEGVKADIVRAREWDQQSIVYEVRESPYAD